MKRPQHVLLYYNFNLLQQFSVLELELTVTGYALCHLWSVRMVLFKNNLTESDVLQVLTVQMSI